MAADDMTVEQRAALCADFLYFGVEYGRECYCGNNLGGNAVDDGDCSFLYGGSSTEFLLRLHELQP